MSNLQVQQIQEENDLQKKIVDLLNAKGPMTRGDMVGQLGTARTTIYDSLAKLMGRNVVDRHPIQNARRGRPKILFQLKGGVMSA